MMPVWLRLDRLRTTCPDNPDRPSGQPDRTSPPYKGLSVRVPVRAQRGTMG